MENKNDIKGGEFMLSDVDPKQVFIPEEFDEEQQMISQSCQDFLDTEVLTVLDRIDSQEEGLMADLLTKAGELGLLGISIPEEYDGFGQSFLTSMLAAEAMGSGYSFAVAFSCHTGIGSLPIVYYGNEEQKQKYLPKLATGEWKGAYCLTEPGAGSDANAGKTKAVLSEDGKHYILNGQKMWITNGGFADVMTVFAKIDNDRVLSAFIVERDYEGITFNPEEKKMGIKGSSTRQIFFNDVKVPVENLLGRRGTGYRIALNILHMGRIKLGGNVIGAQKAATTQSVVYANERKQFGILINSFGAIKHKLAEQVVRTFSTESAVYRASRDIDTLKDAYAGSSDKEHPMITAYNQLAIEAALLKVYGSESLDYIVDEAVQIHGGMGYSAEMPVDRGYRDSRINRIFEGTNEINRLWAIDLILKRGQKKVYDLYPKAEEIFNGLDHLNEDAKTDYFERKNQILQHFKNATLAIIHPLNEKFGRKLSSEQEILMNLSDMAMYIYVMESTMARVNRLQELKPESIAIYKDILDVLFFDFAEKIYKAGREAIDGFAEGDVYQRLIKALVFFTQTDAINVKEARRRIADKLIDDNKYDF